jgi:uncharacterized Zn-binding protein involved in type VI secretion
MMSGKRLILLGDKTSHGGTVVSAQSMMTIDGIPVATIGDKVTCPKCKGTHEIVQGGGNIRLMGRELAREGDKTSCGATLVSVQQSRSTHG